ncbi:DUF4336 domain-containing protein [Burkholderia plantarii]|uniref:DUF4336 domain-containing protein n=1 Tax=Burkholderia plantarii TaxID=41899 RepID=UPI0018DE9915|nr:DUF4336 domain-containing protein [Burkholderia plantarii]MBI0330039.1 DUF4336 domain-containing protein [Burkholderia plantarii]
MESIPADTAHPWRLLADSRPTAIMLRPITTDIWHLQHPFVAGGLRVSSRMTVVRLRDASLWLHSPVPLSAEVVAQLRTLGEVRYIVAPSKAHHLFVADCLKHFPDAALFGAPGLAAKRPDLPNLRELTRSVEPAWAADFEQVFFDGIPIGNETVWFHKASSTLIVTDLCQCWQDDAPFATRAFATLTGVRRRLAVPRTIRLLVKDRQAAGASAARILALPFTRVVMAHDSIVEVDAHRAVEQAFRVFAAR